MRAEKKLDPCDELSCIYCAISDDKTHRICVFGLRHMGCFLEPEIKFKAGAILAIAKTQNTIEVAKSIIRSQNESGRQDI